MWAPEITSVSYGWQLRHSLARCQSRGILLLLRGTCFQDFTPSRFRVLSRFPSVSVPRRGHVIRGPSMPVLQKPFLPRGTPPEQGDSPTPSARVSIGRLAWERVEAQGGGGGGGRNGGGVRGMSYFFHDRRGALRYATAGEKHAESDPSV